MLQFFLVLKAQKPKQVDINTIAVPMTEMENIFCYKQQRVLRKYSLNVLDR